MSNGTHKVSFNYSSKDENQICLLQNKRNLIKSFCDNSTEYSTFDVPSNGKVLICTFFNAHEKQSLGEWKCSYLDLKQ